MTSVNLPQLYQESDCEVRVVAIDDDLRSTLDFRDAQATVRNISTDEALAQLEVFEFDIVDPDIDPAFRFKALVRRAAFREELARRERLRRLNAGNATLSDRRFEAWKALADEVRTRVSVPDVLRWYGVPLVRAGIDPSRKSPRYHSPCPICGGRDRFVSWEGPNSRGYCRRCDWRPDSIAAVRSLIPGNESFRDALTFMAGMVGLEQVA